MPQGNALRAYEGQSRAADRCAQSSGNLFKACSQVQKERPAALPILPILDGQQLNSQTHPQFAPCSPSRSVPPF